MWETISRAPCSFVSLYLSYVEIKDQGSFVSLYADFFIELLLIACLFFELHSGICLFPQRCGEFPHILTHKFRHKAAAAQCSTQSGCSRCNHKRPGNMKHCKHLGPPVLHPISLVEPTGSRLPSGLMGRLGPMGSCTAGNSKGPHGPPSPQGSRLVPMAPMVPPPPSTH